jgi:hypothetical protein
VQLAADATLVKRFEVETRQLDPTVAKVLILGATLVFVVAHIRRYRSTRRAPTSATSSYETIGSQLRRLWRYL